MIFPQLARFTDVALLLLRLMVGIVFVTSGYKHLKDPETRSNDKILVSQVLKSAFFAVSYRPWPNDYRARVSRRRFSALGKPPTCGGGSCSYDRIRLSG